MKNKRLEYLLPRYLDNTITPAEETELFDLLATSQHDEQVHDLMQQAWQEHNSQLELGDQQANKILSAVLHQQNAPVIPLRKRIIRWTAAAAVLLTISITAWFFLNKPPVQAPQPLAKKTIIQDVAPGSTGAILRLADGSSIVLDSAGDGQLTTQANMKVMKQGGAIQYIGNATSAQTSYNTIETPRGRRYQLSLEDGTKVWLNAASSIRFPVAFTGTERKVEITGEVYFEVAKNKQKPFLVQARGATVEVLGTHFNVAAYADEEAVSTTLLEGSVKVSKGAAQKIISPGQQAQVDAKGALTTQQQVNLKEVMAWKDNLFAFNNTDIKKLMRQLSRWYDVEVVFKDENPEPVTFIGGISRAVNLSTVLAMLEQTDEVKFEIQGKKIIVKI